MPLTKDFIAQYIPGDPGRPGQPYIKARPPRTVISYKRVCTQRITPQIVNDQIFYNYEEPVCHSEPVLSYDPGHPGQPYIAPRAPTYAQYILSSNEGWTGLARTIDALLEGDFFEFVVNVNARGVMIGLAQEGFDGYPIGFYECSVIVDGDGIHVFESGVLKKTLSPVKTNTVRIYRQSGGRILYTTSNGGFYQSAKSYSNAITLYAYAVMYSSGDQIDEYDFDESPEVDMYHAPGPVTLRGRGSLTVKNQPKVTMDGRGSLVAVASPGLVMRGVGSLSADPVIEQRPDTITMTGTGSLSAIAIQPAGHGAATLMPLTSRGGDYDYGIAYASLPLLSASGVEGSFVPAAITYGYANLPFLSMYAEGSENEAGAGGDMELPLLYGLGADYAYGFGEASLPQLFAIGYSDDFLPADTVLMVSSLVAEDVTSMERDLVLILTSTGQIQSTLELTREQALELITEITAASVLNLSGIYLLQLVSEGHALSLATYNINDRPDLHESGAVWVVNLESGASSVYEQYGFNSFFTRNGVNYGVAHDGIYRLDGEQDQNELIQALAQLPKTDMGDSRIKNVPQVYAGIASGNRMILKVEADGQTYYYHAEGSNETMTNQRFKIGRGLQGRYWTLTLLNHDGCDFELDTIEFEPVVQQRRLR
jgi:hypothetical protein